MSVAAPTGLSASTISSSQINLDWTNGETYDYSYVERKTGTGSYAVVHTVTGNDSSWSNTGLTNGTKYYYRVAPTGFTATVASSTTIDLTWTNGGTYDYVHVYRKATGGTYAEVSIRAGSATSWTDSGLLNGEQYFYAVKGEKIPANEYSSYSNVDSAITTLTAPSSLHATATSGTQIVLDWTDNTNNETGFKIEESTTGSGSWSQIATVGANIVIYKRTGLTPGDTRYYRVRAYTSYTNSSYSNISGDTTDVGGSSSVTATTSISTSVAGELVGSSSVTVNTGLGGDSAVSAAAYYQYFFGSYNGKVFIENVGYTSDDGNKIDSYWLSKQTDFADEDPECLGKWKTVYAMQLWYKDIDASVPVTIGISTDGGVTWTEQTKTIGTGDEKEKVALYYFIINGNVFQFRIRNNGTDRVFQWTALKALYDINGEYFEV